MSVIRDLWSFKIIKLATQTAKRIQINRFSKYKKKKIAALNYEETNYEMKILSFSFASSSNDIQRILFMANVKGK